MMIRATMLLAALAMCVGLCACGGASSATSDVLAADSAAAVAARQPGDRLAAAGHPGRLAEHPDQLPRRCWHRGVRRARGRLAQRLHSGRAARLLDRDRGELPAVAPLHRRRAGDRPRHRRHRRRDSRRARASRSPTRPRSARSSSRSTRATRSAIQHYSSAPSLTPSTVNITTPAKTGSTPGDLFLAPYQGEGSPGPMIAEQNGSARVVSPAARGRGRDELPGPAVRRQARADLVAGADPRGRLRPGRRRDLQHLLPARGDDPRRQRLPRRPARNPVDPGRHGLDRRVRPDPHEPARPSTARPTACSPTRSCRRST